MRSATALLLALCSLSGCASLGGTARDVMGMPAIGVTPEAVARARGIVQRATETGDGALLESMLASDAILVTETGDTVHGTAAIVGRLAPSPDAPVPYLLHSVRVDRCSDVLVDLGRVQVGGGRLLDYRIEWMARENLPPAIGSVTLTEYAGADVMRANCVSPAQELFATRSVVLTLHPGVGSLWMSGLPSDVEASATGDVACGDPETDSPLLAASVRTRGPWSTTLELTGTHGVKGNVRCRDNHPFSPRVMENTQELTLVGALIGVRWGNVRLAAGPMLARTAWEWRDVIVSEGASIRTERSTTTLGAATSVSIGIPFTGRFLVDMTWREAWFAEQAIDPFRHHIGGTARASHRMLGLGIGVGF